MPIYEYGCSNCGNQLEVIQKISDLPLKKCPECGEESLQKQVSAPAFRLSGSGWYETDFKSDKEKRRNLAGDQKPSESSAGSPDTKKSIDTDKGAAKSSSSDKSSGSTPAKAS
jgi:putative FmdB family regulatory protein